MMINSGLLIQSITETVKKEVKEQKGKFLGMLVATLGASLLQNVLAEKDVLRGSKGTNRAG